MLPKKLIIVLIYIILSFLQSSDETSSVKIIDLDIGFLWLVRLLAIYGGSSKEETKQGRRADLVFWFLNKLDLRWGLQNFQRKLESICMKFVLNVTKITTGPIQQEYTHC